LISLRDWHLSHLRNIFQGHSRDSGSPRPYVHWRWLCLCSGNGNLRGCTPRRSTHRHHLDRQFNPSEHPHGIARWTVQPTTGSGRTKFLPTAHRLWPASCNPPPGGRQARIPIGPNGCPGQLQSPRRPGAGGNRKQTDIVAIPIRSVTKCRHCRWQRELRGNNMAHPRVPAHVGMCDFGYSWKHDEYIAGSTRVATGSGSAGYVCGNWPRFSKPESESFPPRRFLVVHRISGVQ
jgi:hypothetical protein